MAMLDRRDLALLMNSASIVISVELARRIGLNEAVTHQALIQYHAIKAMVTEEVEVFDGLIYVPVTQGELADAVGFLDARTIGKCLAKLEELEMIDSIQFRKTHPMDATKWYAILRPGQVRITDEYGEEDGDEEEPLL